MTFYGKSLGRLFFTLLVNGNYCEICGKKITRSIICEKCFQENFLEKISSASVRKVCHEEICESGNATVREKSVLTAVDSILCLFPYDLWNKRLLFQWKIRGERSLSFMFAKIVYETLSKHGISIVVPVPPRPGKIQENGWDQIDELCNCLDYFFGITILRLLERKSKVQMKKLNREQRLKISDTSYFLKDKKEIDKILKKNNCSFPERLCLIDDVMTTGATIDSCGTCLKEGGGKEVLALTLFKV